MHATAPQDGVGSISTASSDTPTPVISIFRLRHRSPMLCPPIRMGTRRTVIGPIRTAIITDLTCFANCRPRGRNAEPQLLPAPHSVDAHGSGPGGQVAP